MSVSATDGKDTLACKFFLYSAAVGALHAPWSALVPKEGWTRDVATIKSAWCLRGSGMEGRGDAALTKQPGTKEKTFSTRMSAFGKMEHRKWIRQNPFTIQKSSPTQNLHWGQIFRCRRAGFCSSHAESSTQNKSTPAANYIKHLSV